jgi:outer membrane immunogenic protein
MRRATILGIGALAVTTITLPATAADLGRPVKAPPMAPVAAPPPFSWAGCYIGGHAGGKWPQHDTTLTVATFPNVTVFGVGNGFDNGNDDASFIGGGQLGCQWQSGSWVVGIEGDFSGTDINRTFVAGPLVRSPFLPGDALRFQNDWESSVRGRLGWAWDRWMVYATGGVAFANVEATFFPIDSALAFSDSRTLTGWTIGGGVEYAFWQNVSFGLEYRFSSYDTERFNHGTILVGNNFAIPLTSDHDFETHQVTARLNWRFYSGALFGKGPVAPY